MVENVFLSERYFATAKIFKYEFFWLARIIEIVKNDCFVYIHINRIFILYINQKECMIIYELKANDSTSH